MKGREGELNGDVNRDELEVQPSGGGKRRRKMRKKEGLTIEDINREREKEARLAQEVLKKFPDVGVVRVDRRGNIIGGADPFEGTDVNPLEDIPSEEDLDKFPEVAGEIEGMDEPADSPWRIEAEKIIRTRVEASGLRCHDIMWTYHKLEVTVKRGDVAEDDEEADSVDSKQLMQTIKAVNFALEEREDELYVLGRHELIVATPGVKNILSTKKEFQAFKGFDVIVKTGGPFQNKRLIKGKLVERTFDELIITKSGRKVRMPLALVDEVRLPEARREDSSSRLEDIMLGPYNPPQEEGEDEEEDHNLTVVSPHSPGPQPGMIGLSDSAEEDEIFGTSDFVDEDEGVVKHCIVYPATQSKQYPICTWSVTRTVNAVSRGMVQALPQFFSWPCAGIHARRDAYAVLQKLLQVFPHWSGYLRVYDY
ncbi:unnamed protein product [Choristocarpus tenellus]